MSRVGKLPISIPEGVNVKINRLNVEVTGPRGSVSKSFAGGIEIIQEENYVKVLLKEENSRAMWGTARSIISNMIQGVSQGFSQELEMKGVGYNASLEGAYLVLSLGKSHSTKIEIPQDLKLEVPKSNTLILFAVDKEKLGQFAALIKKQRPVENYKGKGIKRKGDYVQIKVGKKN